MVLQDSSCNLLHLHTLLQYNNNIALQDLFLQLAVDVVMFAFFMLQLVHDDSTSAWFPVRLEKPYGCQVPCQNIE